MSSGSHGEQAKRTFAVAVRFAGLVVAGASTVRWCSTQPAGDRLSADSAARRPRGVRPDLSGLAGTGSLVDLAGCGLVPAGADAGRADDDRASGNGLRPLSPEGRPGRRSAGSEGDKAVWDFRRCWRADWILRGQFRCTGPESGRAEVWEGDFSGHCTTSTKLIDVIPSAVPPRQPC